MTVNGSSMARVFQRIGGDIGAQIFEKKKKKSECLKDAKSRTRNPDHVECL
jgi:hypothetical protein